MLLSFPPSRPPLLKYRAEIIWVQVQFPQQRNGNFHLWIFWLLVQTRNIRGKETGKCSLSIWTSKNFENPHVKALKNMYLCDRSCTYNSPSVSVPLEETKLPFWNVRRRYIDSTFSNLLLIGDHHFSRGSEILNWETDLMTVRSPLPFLSLTILEFAGL